jgi:hypothetical protein
MSVTILYSISDQESAEDGDTAFHEEAVLPYRAEPISAGVIAAEKIAEQHFSDFEVWREEYSDETESACVRVVIIEPAYIAGIYEVVLAVVSDARLGLQVQAIRARLAEKAA